MPASPSRRTADLTAVRGGTRYAVEVRRASRPLRPDGAFEPARAGATLPYPTIADYFALLWREKSGQLEATRLAQSCGAGAILVVAEGAPGPAWAAALDAAWAAAGAPRDVHFALLCETNLLCRPPLEGPAMDALE